MNLTVSYLIFVCVHSFPLNVSEGACAFSSLCDLFINCLQVSSNQELPMIIT